MTGFDETVPPDTDPSTDGTATDPESAAASRTDGDVHDNVVKPEGGPEALEADGEDAPPQQGPNAGGGTDERPMGGDDDIAAGHLGE